MSQVCVNSASIPQQFTKVYFQATMTMCLLPQLSHQLHAYASQAGQQIYLLPMNAILLENHCASTVSIKASLVSSSGMIAF